VEKGMDCRMDTKRKIILALGYKLTEKGKVFKNEDSLARQASASADLLYRRAQSPHCLLEPMT
jgi:hypothetical protein